MEKSSTARLVELVGIIETVGGYVTLQMLQAFVTIASYNEAEGGFGMNMTLLGDRLGMASATRTRTVGSLSDRRGGNRQEEGLGLLQTATDPDDSRAKVVFLTPKGRRVWAMMKAAVSD